MTRSGFSLALISALLSFFTTAVSAQEMSFSVENKTTKTLYVAYGKASGDTVTTVGWYTLKPQEKKVLTSGYSFVYLYAQAGGKSWSGDTNLFVNPQKGFEVTMRNGQEFQMKENGQLRVSFLANPVTQRHFDEAKAKGFETKKFMKIDMRGQASFNQRLWE